MDGTHKYPEYTYKNLREKNSALISALSKSHDSISLPGLAWSVGLRSYWFYRGWIIFWSYPWRWIMTGSSTSKPLLFFCRILVEIFRSLQLSNSLFLAWIYFLFRLLHSLLRFYPLQPPLKLLHFSMKGGVFCMIWPWLMNCPFFYLKYCRCSLGRVCFCKHYPYWVSPG